MDGAVRYWSLLRPAREDELTGEDRRSAEEHRDTGIP
jgi:hypothetical protein